jgi:hypothetical protein
MADGKLTKDGSTLSGIKLKLEDGSDYRHWCYRRHVVGHYSSDFLRAAVFHSGARFCQAG